MALPPVITYGGRPISEGVDLHIEPDPRYDHTTPHRTATYGDYGGVGESDNLKARCEVEISYSNISYVINNDNSITVSGNITGGILRRTFVASSTNRQEITVKFNGQQTFHTIPLLFDNLVLHHNHYYICTLNSNSPEKIMAHSRETSPKKLRLLCTLTHGNIPQA